MTDQELEHTKSAFFAMIRANPKDDATREVFADWCEENGDMDLAGMLRGGSRKWIEEFAASIGGDFDTYDGLMGHVETIADSKSKWTEGYVEHDSQSMRDAWYHGEEEFWKHYEVMTGKPKPSEDDGVYRWYFSCSC